MGGQSFLMSSRRYIDNKSVPFAESFQESGPATPIFFILSPGVDPLKVTQGKESSMDVTHRMWSYWGRRWGSHLRTRTSTISPWDRARRWGGWKDGGSRWGGGRKDMGRRWEGDLDEEGMRWGRRKDMWRRKEGEGEVEGDDQVVAEEAMEVASAAGHWVVLQVIWNKW